MARLSTANFLVSSSVVLCVAASCDGPVSSPSAEVLGEAGGDGISEPTGSGGGAGSASTSEPTGSGDSAGASAAVETSCQPSDPDLADTDAAELFDYPHVPAFDLFLPADEWENLKIHARDEVYVPAEACFEGKSIGRIGMRFKGYYGTLYECFDEQDQMICPRLSMKLKFSEYDSDFRFFGLKRLNFNAYRYDDTRMRERLTYDLYRAMGVVAPRAAWAVLRVNGESQGLFGMVEQVDGRFTADRWPDNPDGNLYKEVWPSQSSAGQIAAGLKTNEETAEVEAFVAFVAGMDAASEEQLTETLGEYTDLEYLARYMAVDDAVANYDGITYFWTDGVSTGNHNYYFYEEGPKRFTLIPWDVEATFWINPDHQAPHWTEMVSDCSLTYEYWGGLAKAPTCDRVVRALAKDLSGWRAAAEELLSGPFAEETMVAAIDRYADFIRAEINADPTPLAYGTFDDSVEYLRGSVPDLRARLEQLLTGQDAQP